MWPSSARLLAGASLLCAAALPVFARAQDYPSRSILFVVPFTPGTTADSLARLIQVHLSQRWRVPVVVENKPGAAGIIGIDAVAKANPDGYTCLFTSTAFGTLAATNPKLPYDPDKSFAPVMLVGTSPLSLLVSNNFPAKTVKELIARAKERPGEFNYASAGAGSVFHLAMELLQHEAGTKMVHVPYKGTTGVVNDLIAGHVPVTMMVFQTAAPLVQSGRVRMLAVMSSQRIQALPDVPTMVESGFPNMVVDAWTGVMVPAKTPSAVIDRFNDEINRVLALPEMKAAAAKIDVTLVGGAPESLGALVKKEIKQWTEVAQRANIKPE
jgi:tripartite-type tricarboxylate transporter receptor subunit TctC